MSDSAALLRSLPKIVVGTMNFGVRTTDDEARAIVEFALSHGLSWFDTANVYGNGAAEEILGRLLEGRRDQVVIASKVGFRGLEAGPEGLSANVIDQAISASLKRLRTDHLDICYLHVPDPQTPLAETVAAMGRAVERGQTLHWAVSNHASWQIMALDNVCDELGVVRPIISQVVYNILVRQVELEYLRFAKFRGIATLAYNPLAGGLLTGQHLRRDRPAEGSRLATDERYRRRYWSARLCELRDEFATKAEAFGMSVTELAYRWLAHREIQSVIAGPRVVDHLSDAWRFVQEALLPALLTEVDEISATHTGTALSYAR